MATETARLILDFATAGGDTVRLSYSHADPDVEASDVQALVSGIITNGSIFKAVPITAKKAAVVVTSTTDIPLS